MAKILIAEDHDDLRDIHTSIIKALFPSHEVVPLSDKQSALSLIEAGEKFDLIIANYGNYNLAPIRPAPKVNGLELLNWVRGGGANKETPFILFSSISTGKDGEDLRMECEKLNAIFENKDASRLREIVTKIIS